MVLACFVARESTRVPAVIARLPRGARSADNSAQTGRTALEPQPKLLKSKLFWVGLLYFSEGFPLGVFYEIFPVWFRQQGVDLRAIGAISLLGLAWTLKFLWAPAIDHYRRHRYWMATVDLAMGAVMLVFAAAAGFGPWVWAAIAVFTLLSATNDVAIDGYTIELLDKNELGFANGVRIGLYRVGMLASGLVLILSDWITWSGAFVCAALILAACAAAVLAAPPERAVERDAQTTLRAELARIVTDPKLAASVLALALGALALVDQVTKWSRALSLPSGGSRSAPQSRRSRSAGSAAGASRRRRPTRRAGRCSARSSSSSRGRTSGRCSRSS